MRTTFSSYLVLVLAAATSSLANPVLAINGSEILTRQFRGKNAGQASDLDVIAFADMGCGRDADEEGLVGDMIIHRWPAMVYSAQSFGDDPKRSSTPFNSVKLSRALKPGEQLDVSGWQSDASKLSQDVPAQCGAFSMTIQYQAGMTLCQLVNPGLCLRLNMF